MSGEKPPKTEGVAGEVEKLLSTQIEYVDEEQLPPVFSYDREGWRDWLLENARKAHSGNLWGFAPFISVMTRGIDGNRNIGFFSEQIEALHSSLPEEMQERLRQAIVDDLETLDPEDPDAPFVYEHFLAATSMIPCPEVVSILPELLRKIQKTSPVARRELKHVEGLIEDRLDNQK